MQKTERFKWMALAIFVAMASMTFVACQDDDDDDEKSEEQKQAEAEAKAQSDADVFWGVVSQLTAPGTWAEDYLNATFQPNIGVPDETNSLVRIVHVNDLAHAAKRFANLVGADDIDENTPTYTYSNPAVGTLTYRQSNTGRELATVDVSIKQMPGLQRIVYRDPDQAGENSWFKFDYRCYYRFGDVISRVRKSDHQREYWICVRPAFGPEKKEDSHWVSLSPLPEENVWTYYSKTTNQNYYLPNALGTNKEQMQNLAELLYAMNHGQQWQTELESNKKVDMFHDFSRTSLPYMNKNFFTRVGLIWKKLGLYKKTMNVDATTVESALTSGLNLIYGNKSWSTTFSWAPSLNVATYKAGGAAAKANMHDCSYKSKGNSVRESGFDVNTLYSAENFPFHNFSSFFGDNGYYWVIRHATGAELSETGTVDILEPIAGMTEEYTYNGYYGLPVSEADKIETTPDISIEATAKYVGESFYRIGDVVQDQNDGLWFCIQPSGTGVGMEKTFEDFAIGDCSWFISFAGGFTGSFDHYNNLPNQKEAKAITALLALYANDLTGKELKDSKYYPSYTNIKEHAKVDLIKLYAGRDSVFYQGRPTDNPRIPGRTNHVQILSVNVAYSDPQYESQKKQPIFRLIYNNAWFDRGANGETNYDNRSVQILGQTRYAMGDRETMFLQDVMSQDKVNQYAKDRWVTLPWFKGGNSADPNTSEKGPGYAEDIFPHEQPRNDTYTSVNSSSYQWNQTKGDFLFDFYKSMYNEPIVICRLMAVRDRGQESHFGLNGTILKTVSLIEDARFPRELGLGDNFSLLNLYKIGKIDYVEDGQQSRLWFLGQ